MWFLLTSVAFAASPRVAWTQEVTTEIPDLAVVGDDSRFVGFVSSGDSGVRVLDTATWEIRTLAPCPAAEASSVGGASSASDRLFVGCSDGTLTWALTNAGAPELSGAKVSTGGDPILGLAGVDGQLVAVSGPASGGNYTVWSEPTPRDLADGDSLVAGQTLAAVGFGDLGQSGSFAVLTQGQTFASRISPAGGGVATNDLAAGVVDALDVLDNDGNAADAFALIADPGSGVLSFNLATLDLAQVLADASGVQGASALALYEGELLVADTDAFLRFDYNPNTGLPSNTLLDEAPFPDGASGSPVAEMVDIGGYVVAGTEDGALWVYTDRPWVDVTTDTVGPVTTGEEVSLRIESDVAGAWTLVLNPTSGDTGGVTLASGTLTAAAAVETQVTVGDAWEEGLNQLRVLVDDGTSAAGHDAVLVDLDSPPSGVVLRESSVGFGDQKLTLAFAGVSDADLAGYDVYVTEGAFVADDYEGCASAPCGGPEWDGESNLRTPISVAAVPGATVEVTISPLTNNTTYYLAVRAIDAGGQESPMSNVVTGTPTETFSAAELAGEPGGFGCASSGRPARGSLLWLGGLGLLGAALRRRGARGTAGAAAVGLALLAAPVAEAHDPDAVADAAAKASGLDPALVDRTATRGQMSLRVGPLTVSDRALSRVFGDGGYVTTWFEGGPRVTRFLAFTGGIGFLQKKGFLVSNTGAASSDENRLQAIPLSGNATFRLDIFKDQPIVPFASVGGDYWLWRERWDIDREAGTKDQVGGGKAGWHWAAGGQILLDVFDRAQASRLQARTGIDDSYLTVEYREQTIGDGTGLDFSGSLVGVGLTLTY